MPPILRFIIYRLLFVPVTLFVITLVLYGMVMLTPPEQRAELYFPKNFNPERLSPEHLQRYIELIIQRNHLRDPFPIQYGLWVAKLARGDWGWSPVMSENVLPALLRRTPVTAELTIYSLLFFIPLGLISGVKAARKKDGLGDHRFRLTAFLATSTLPFVLALVLLSIFYVFLYWFPPDRVSMRINQDLRDPAYQTYTGLLTVDGFLNGRPDISLDALRHLVLPVITLSLVHWATLGRVTRITMIEELGKDYIIAGRARGLSERSVVWKHALRNSLSPALASSALSAAFLFTGVFVVEVIYNFHGVSDLVVAGVRGIPDAPTILGFAVYSVIVVLFIMLILDIIQALLDPRIREGIIGS
jgi:ABC-type dipeptide/oligopeptide/nickel transport system permease component